MSVMAHVLMIACSKRYAPKCPIFHAGLIIYVQRLSLPNCLFWMKKSPAGTSFITSLMRACARLMALAFLCARKLNFMSAHQSNSALIGLIKKTFQILSRAVLPKGLSLNGLGQIDLLPLPAVMIAGNI